jgi:hypothetical protein
MSSDHQQSTCSPLPAEVWASVITYLDEYITWMVCRHVSKMVRNEAERDFAKYRLPNVISLKWDFSAGEAFWEDDEFSECDGHFELTRFHEYVESGERAIFDINVCCKLVRVSDGYDFSPNRYRDGYDKSLWCRGLKEEIVRCLTYSDTAHSEPGPKYSYASRQPYCPTRFIYVGMNMNEVEMPGLYFDIDKQQMSFPWKQSLTDYFGEECYVRTMRRVRGIEDTRSPILEELEEFKTHKLRNSDHEDEDESDATRFFRGEIDLIGKSNEELYVGAYNSRSSRSHIRAGLDNEMPPDVADRILQRLRGVRRRQLYEVTRFKNEEYWEDIEAGLCDIYVQEKFETWFSPTQEWQPTNHTEVPRTKLPRTGLLCCFKGKENGEEMMRWTFGFEMWWAVCESLWAVVMLVLGLVFRCMEAVGARCRCFVETRR